jgi:periplasmic divalent cation tolerance protein
MFLRSDLVRRLFTSRKNINKINTRSAKILNSALVRNIMSKPNQSEYSAAWITVPNEQVAENLAKSLIENKLVACVNVIPKIKSYYMWEGKLNADEELLLMIKTKTILLDEITTFVKKNHPYDVPEVISAQLGPGNPDYYEWIGKSCK